MVFGILLGNLMGKLRKDIFPIEVSHVVSGKMGRKPKGLACLWCSPLGMMIQFDEHIFRGLKPPTRWRWLSWTVVFLKCEIPVRICLSNKRHQIIQITCFVCRNFHEIDGIHPGYIIQVWFFCATVQPESLIIQSRTSAWHLGVLGLLIAAVG